MCFGRSYCNKRMKWISIMTDECTTHCYFNSKYRISFVAIVRYCDLNSAGIIRLKDTHKKQRIVLRLFSLCVCVCASLFHAISLALSVSAIYLFICMWLFVQLNAMQLWLLQLYPLFRSSPNECLNMPCSPTRNCTIYLLIALERHNCNDKFKTDVSAVFVWFK